MNATQKIEKFCIFCGGRPQDKSREHVIPQWLIRLTGNPKRKVLVGSGQRNGRQHIRQFAFDQFTFPACEECNNTYSNLEGEAAKVVQALLSKQPVSEAGCDNFLSWLDKVRVGLWLGNRYLTGNQLEVDPNFFIASRVATADRMAWIMRDDLTDGVNMIGVQTPLFTFMPSAFGLRINDLMIVSASTDLMLSRQLGFPYASKRVAELGRREMALDLAPGSKRITKPIFRVQPRLSALRIYQPIFSKFTAPGVELFDNEYVRQRSLNWEQGRGRVFVEGFGELRPGGIGKLDYLALEGFIEKERMYQFGASVLEVQNDLLRMTPSLGRLPPPVRRFEAKRWRFAHSHNRLSIKAYLEGRVVRSQAEIDRINAGGGFSAPA